MTASRAVPRMSQKELRELSRDALLERRRLLDGCYEGDEEVLAIDAGEGWIVQKESLAWRGAYAQISDLLERRYIQSLCVPVIGREQLKAMTTGRLLKRIASLRARYESDAGDFSLAIAREVKGILFRDTPEWQTAWRDVKEVLATREHMERGSRELRQADARLAHGKERRVRSPLPRRQ